jgi:hypothetical protein
MIMSGVVDPRRSGGASLWIAQTNRNRSLPPSACFGRLLSTVVTTEHAFRSQDAAFNSMPPGRFHDSPIMVMPLSAHF